MNTMKRVMLGLAGVAWLLASLSGYGQVALKNETGWSYHGITGPDSWGYLSPLYQLCKTSQIQSPINIETSKTVKAKRDKALSFHYDTLPFVLDRGAHNVYINFGNKLREDYVTFDNKKYFLSQVHFHVPAEHTLDNKRAAMEAHLVHTDLEGHLLVVGVLLNKGKKSPYLADLLSKPFFKPSQSDQKTVELSPQDLLPASHDYYSYVGSLTVPACLEPVRWIVLKQPLSLSRSQLRAFKKHVVKYNARPVQPLNKRRVVSVHLP